MCVILLIAGLAATVISETYRNVREEFDMVCEAYWGELDLLELVLH